MYPPCAFSVSTDQRPSSHREWRLPLLRDAQRESLLLGEQLSRGGIGTAEGCGCSWSSRLKEAENLLSLNMSRAEWGRAGRWNWTLIICVLNPLLEFWMFDRLRKKNPHRLIDTDLNCWWNVVATADAVSHLQPIKPQVCLPYLRLHYWHQKRSHLTCFYVFSKVLILYLRRPHMFKRPLLSQLLPPCGANHTVTAGSSCFLQRNVFFMTKK